MYVALVVVYRYGPAIVLAQDRICQVQASCEEHQPSSYAAQVGSGGRDRFLYDLVPMVEILLSNGGSCCAKPWRGGTGRRQSGLVVVVVNVGI
jgi:hypothetical protein